MEIRVIVDLKDGDLRAAVKATQRRAQLMLLLIGGALCVEGLVLAAGHGWQSPLAWLAFVVGAFALAYALVRPALLARRLREAVPPGGPTTYTLDDEGVRLTSARGEEKLAWSAFVRVVEMEQLFFLHPTRGATFLVPKRAFASPADVDAARALFTRKGPGFRRAR